MGMNFSGATVQGTVIVGSNLVTVGQQGTGNTTWTVPTGKTWKLLGWSAYSHTTALTRIDIKGYNMLYTTTAATHYSDNTPIILEEGESFYAYSSGGTQDNLLFTYEDITA